MDEICNILGVRFDNVTKKQALERLMEYLDSDGRHIIFTPNPEFVMCALKDEYFMQVLNKSDMNIPDGIGIVIASGYTKKRLPERVAGYDLIQEAFEKMSESGKTVYFLGGAPSIAEKAKKAMEEKHKGIKIIGTQDGYFDEKKEKLIIEEINTLKPDLLLVGIGFPRQEKWIYEHKDILNVKAMIGVGGSFDGMCGNVKRAPKIFIKLNLEWFYRLIRQPSRLGRMLQLPAFMLKVIAAKIKGEL